MMIRGGNGNSANEYGDNSNSANECSSDGDGESDGESDGENVGNYTGNTGRGGECQRDGACEALDGDPSQPRSERHHCWPGFNFFLAARNNGLINGEGSLVGRSDWVSGCHTIHM